MRSLIPQFERRLKALGDHPMVGETRSCGLVGALEMVSSKRTRKPFDPKKAVGPSVVRMIQEHGLILRAIGDSIAICPPMIITEAELDTLFDRLELGLKDALVWAHHENLLEA
ncbi:MAG: aminotransferase class III-fold pyridoxal phosphate-dependent enzyme [Nitratireductor sp.]